MWTEVDACLLRTFAAGVVTRRDVLARARARSHTLAHWHALARVRTRSDALRRANSCDRGEDGKS